MPTAYRFHLARHRAYSRLAAKRDLPTVTANHYRGLADRHLAAARKIRARKEMKQ